MKTIKIKWCNEKGVVAPLVAIMLSVLLGAVALAIDVGYMMNTRTELQRIADAAALAGARTLGRLYECNADLASCTQPMPYEDQLTYEPDAAIIKQASMDVGLQNQAGGSKTGITIIENEIVIGNWDGAAHTLTANSISPDAVRVTVRRDGSANGPITTFFARIFGINTVDVSATATAALTGESSVGPGKVIPVGISYAWYLNKGANNFCDQPIKFYPSNDPESCAGWTTFFNKNASASYLRKDILEEWLNNPSTPPTPEVKAGEEIAFTGGTLGNQTFTAFYNLWDYMRKNDGDGNDAVWTAMVPVYDSTSCENPNQDMKVIGFSTVEITNVVPPNVEITATVKCDNVVSGRGGGAPTGTKGSIPGLVQ